MLDNKLWASVQVYNWMVCTTYFFFTHLNVLEVYKEYTTFPLFVRNSSAVNLSTFIWQEI